MPAMFKLSRTKVDVFNINIDQYFPEDGYTCEITTRDPEGKNEAMFSKVVEFTATRDYLNYLGDPELKITGSKEIKVAFYLSDSDSHGFILRRYDILCRWIDDNGPEIIRPYFMDNYELHAAIDIIRNVICLFKHKGYYIDDTDNNPIGI